VSPRNWKFRVEDILGAINAIEGYTRNMTPESFSADPRTLDAVLHNISVMGEAATCIPDEIAQQFPEIPWDKMRAIRNLVVHMYFGIRKDILWQTVRQDLPELIPHLKRMLQPV